MGEQLADGDVLFAVGGELGQVFGDGVVGADSPLLVKLHDRGCGHERLGEGGHVEDGVEGHGLLCGQEGARSVAGAVNDLAVVANNENGSGNLMVRDGAVQDAIRDGEGGRREGWLGSTLSSGVSTVKQRDDEKHEGKIRFEGPRHFSIISCF